MATKSLNSKARGNALTRFWSNVVTYKALLVFLIPGLIVMVINNYMPMAGLVMAFKSMDNTLGILKSPWSGFKNFEFLFNSPDMWMIVRNTLGYNLLFLSLSAIFNVGLAILVTELRNRRCAKIYQTFLMLPYFFSYVMVACIVNAFLDSGNGYINNFLTSIGLNSVDWYAEPTWWPFILTLVYFWVQNGYGAIIYIATITGFDQQIFEAAEIDGATRIQKIFRITLPMLKPTVVILTILSLGSIFHGNFGLFYQVPMNSPLLYPVTDVMDTYIFRALTSMSDVGMTTAAGLVQSVVGFVLVVAVNLVVRRMDPESALF